MKYRDRTTGEIIFGRDVRERAQHRKASRILVPGKKKSDPLVPAKTSAVFLAADETQWGQFEFDLALVDPIVEQPQPSYDAFTQHLIEGKTVKIKERYFQTWVIVERFANIGELRTALLSKLKDIANTKRALGITVEGVRFKTNPLGMAMLANATGRAKVVWISGGKSTVFNKKEMAGRLGKATDYVEACYEKEANLMGKIRRDSDPSNIDLEKGWPSVRR